MVGHQRNKKVMETEQVSAKENREPSSLDEIFERKGSVNKDTLTCTCHRLRSIFPENMSHHIHIGCLQCNFDIGRWRRQS